MTLDGYLTMTKILPLVLLFCKEISAAMCQMALQQMLSLLYYTALLSNPATHAFFLSVLPLVCTESYSTVKIK